jgi:hypothetical protein
MYYEFVDSSIGFYKAVDRCSLETQSLWGKANLHIINNNEILGTFECYGDFLAWEEMAERSHWVPKFEYGINDFSFVYRYSSRPPLPIAVSNIVESTFVGEGYVEVSTSDGGRVTLLTYESFLKFCEGHNIMKSEISSAVDPAHYKSYIEDLQWLDAMSRIPTLKDPAKFEAAVELQVRKYLDRNGQKDASVQELLKSLFYLKYLIAYKIKGDPIRVEDVNKILEEYNA